MLARMTPHLSVLLASFNCFNIISNAHNCWFSSSRHSRLPPVGMLCPTGALGLTMVVARRYNPFTNLGYSILPVLSFESIINWYKLSFAFVELTCTSLVAMIGFKCVCHELCIVPGASFLWSTEIVGSQGYTTGESWSSRISLSLVRLVLPKSLRYIESHQKRGLVKYEVHCRDHTHNQLLLDSSSGNSTGPESCNFNKHLSTSPLVTLVMFMYLFFSGKTVFPHHTSKLSRLG